MVNIPENVTLPSQFFLQKLASKNPALLGNEEVFDYVISST